MKQGISVCSCIIRLMNNQTKSLRKATFRTKKRKRRQECCGYCENCTTIGLRLARLGCVGFSKRQTVLLKDNSDVPKARLGTLPKISTSSK